MGDGRGERMHRMYATILRRSSGPHSSLFEAALHRPTAKATLPTSAREEERQERRRTGTSSESSSRPLLRLRPAWMEMVSVV